MISSEIVRGIDSHRDDIRQNASHLDMTYVFNRHADTIDAYDSVQQVEPNSLVFIEGVALDGVEGIPNLLSALTYVRINLGKDHDDYIKLKASIIKGLSTYLTAPALSYEDFSRHQLMELILLLEKDCVISQADYRPIENEDMNEHFGKLNEYSLSRSSTGNLTEVEYTKKLLNDYQKGIHFNHIREIHAVLYASGFIKNIKDYIDQADDLNRSPSNKVKAYIIYGSAHQKSLVARFKEFGYSGNTLTLMDIPEYSMIAESHDDAVENRRRAIAFKAIQSLLYYLPEDYLIDRSIQEELYEGLTYLNDDQEETQSVINQVVQTKRMYAIDPSQAIRWTESLLQHIKK